MKTIILIVGILVLSGCGKEPQTIVTNTVTNELKEPGASADFCNKTFLIKNDKAYYLDFEDARLRELPTGLYEIANDCKVKVHRREEGILKVEQCFGWWCASGSIPLPE